LKTIFVIFFILFNNLVWAEDILMRESQKCKRYFQHFESKYNIPAYLLQAIALVESGIYHPTNKYSVTWPWTINIGGKAYYFENKGEAIKFVRIKRQEKVESIDIGCMQVNLKYHAHAFPNIETGFEPFRNIEYGAKFLRENYDIHRSWGKAVAYYHSANSERGEKYARQVFQAWKKINKGKLIVQEPQKNEIVTNRQVNSEYIEKLKRRKKIVIKKGRTKDDAEIAKLSRRVIKKYN